MRSAWKRRCKNADGKVGARFAWKRRNELFEPVTDFDWNGFDASDAREVITQTDVAAIFKDGALPKGEAVKKLRSNTGASQASCYRALTPGGRFGSHLRVERGRLAWK